MSISTKGIVWEKNLASSMVVSTGRHLMSFSNLKRRVVGGVKQSSCRNIWPLPRRHQIENLQIGHGYIRMDGLTLHYYRN